MKQAVCRKCRREGAKLFLKGERCLGAKCSFSRRPYTPGPHGMVSRGKKLSDYGLQLREKQKAKAIYNLGEAQFRRYYQIAARKKGSSGTTLLQLLEARLDNLCYRLGFAASRRSCRQLVLHGHVFVGDKKVHSPSYQVKPGEIIELQDKKLKLVKTELPVWLKLEGKKYQGELIKPPAREELPTEINEDLIVEFYSK